MIKAQDGTKLPTAPKAEDRYANSIRLYNGHPRFKYDIRYLDGQTTGVVLDTPYTTIPAIITQQVIGNDTIYRETPDQKRFSLRGFPVTRTATNTDSNRQEFETMHKRFNTAWGVAKHQDGNKIERTPFNLDPKITYKTPEFVPTYNKTVPEINVISAKLPGVEVTAPDLSKTLRFPYGGINVVSKSINGGLDRKQRTFVNPFEGHDLVASKQEGGLIEKSDNTRVQKPIPGIISPDSEVRTYDNIPVRVSKHYPYQDKYYLGNPARPMYSRDKNVQLNGIYPSVYGVELDVLAPEYIQKINGNDTTYYVQGGDKNYYPVAGQQDRPAFREAFKNPKARGNRPNYFDTTEKMEKVKQVVNGWVKKNLQGGLIAETDNTRVASGRPQQIQNEVPYGAGKTGVADSPMVLFDNPYVQGLLLAAGPLVKPKKLGAKTKETDINTELTLTKLLKASRNAYEVRKEDKLLHINKPIKTKHKYELSYDKVDARHSNSGQSITHNDYMKYLEQLVQKYPDRKRYERIQMRILNATDPAVRKAAQKDLKDFLLNFKERYGY